MHRVLSSVLAASMLAGCGARAASTSAPAATDAPPTTIGPSAPPTLGPTAAPTPTPAPSPSLAPVPPNGRIAFVLDTEDEAGTEIFIANTDGSDVVALTDDGARKYDLIWSLDGSRLFFKQTTVQPCGDTYCFPTRLISIAADGTDRRDLGSIAYPYYAAAFSPDGRHVAYGGEGFRDGIPIVVLDRATGTVARLAAWPTRLAWSPDGSRLLVVDNFGRWVRVIDAGTGERLVHIDDDWAAEPVGWTTDGGSILYRRCAPTLSKPEAIACLEGPPSIVDLEDPDRTPRLYEGPIPGPGVPSPDGAWLATLGTGGVYVAPAGGVAELVVELELGVNALDSTASWSPDGSWIAFQGRVGSVFGVFAVPRTGGEPVHVIVGGDPAWAPG